MNISIDQMREEIINAYSSENWREKTNAMCDSQIIAIYHSMLYSNRFKKKKPVGQVYYQGRKYGGGGTGAARRTTSKTNSEAPRTPCERLFVDETESCEGGKQVGFDELMRE